MVIKVISSLKKSKIKNQKSKIKNQKLTINHEKNLLICHDVGYRYNSGAN